jgi:hypothetical protein
MKRQKAGRRRKKCVLSADEIRQQGRIDLAAIMSVPLDPAAKDLPRPLGEELALFAAPKAINPREQAKFDATRASGGLLPVKSVNSTAREARATIYTPSTIWERICPETTQAPRTENPGSRPGSSEDKQNYEGKTDYNIHTP